VTLRDELTVLAEDARCYGDPEAAIRTARRRRIVGLVTAPVLACVAVAAVLAGPYWRLATGRAPGEASAGTDLTAAGPAPTLREGAAVGRAAFAYTVQGRTWLVTRDRHRYELRSASPGADATSLSPDGRWLVVDGQLRDLTSGLQRSMQGLRVLAWSPDAAWLLVEDAHEQYLVQPARGRIDVVRSATALAVLDDGTVVSQDDDGSGSPKVATLGVLDPYNGAELRQVVVDARGTLPGQEAITQSQGVSQVRFGPDDQVLVAVTGGSSGSHSALLVSWRAPQRVTAIPGADGNQRWLPLGFDDGAVLMKSEADRSPVELRAWRDGQSSLLFRLPPGSAVLPPGGVRAS